jgi:hypothetical protein
MAWLLDEILSHPWKVDTRFDAERLEEPARSSHR